MAESSGRIVNGLRDAGHRVTVIHLGAAPPPEMRELTVGSPEDAAEPERIYWSRRDSLAGSVLAGFGGNEAGYYAALWARWLGTGSAVFFRGNDFDRNIHDMRRAWMTNFILEHAGTVGAVSSEMAARIRTMRKGPVMVTHNGIDCAAFAELPGDADTAAEIRARHFHGGAPVAGMFGELKAKKGLSMALSLFSTFGLGERARLLTVGSMSEQAAEACARNIGGSWAHVPFAPREALVPYYLACDAVLIPSLYDGMPNVLLESLALGRIVVASGAGAMPDVIEHGRNGFLFGIGDHRAAAAALDGALSMDAGARGRIEREARETAATVFTPARELSCIESCLGAAG